MNGDWPDPFLLNRDDVKALASQARALEMVTVHPEWKNAFRAIQFGSERLWRLLENTPAAPAPPEQSGGQEEGL